MVTMSETIHELLARYGAARREADAWRAEWAPVLSRMEELDAEVAMLAHDLAAALAEACVDFVEDRDFEVRLVRPDRGRFDAARLPDWVRAAPGVMRQVVDTQTVRRLVRAGVLDPDIAAAAWEPAPASPYVRVTVKQEG